MRESVCGKGFGRFRSKRLRDQKIDCGWVFPGV